MKKKVLIIGIIFLTILIGLGFGVNRYFSVKNENEKKVVDILEYKNYTNLGIVSARKPDNAHLLIETNSLGTMYLADSVDAKEIYKTINKGANWSQPNANFTRTYDVIMWFHDRANSKLYGAETLQIFEINLSDDVITNLGLPDVTGRGFTSGNPIDLYIIGSTLYTVMYSEDSGVKTGLLIYHWTGAAWVFDAVDVDGAILISVFGQAVVVGNISYFIKYDITNSQIEILKFDSTGPTLTNIESLASRAAPDSQSQWGMAYNGSDILYFIAEFTGDNKDYLHSYTITTDTLTTLGEYNVALMLNRNTASGVMEKAFHLTEDKLYQLHATIPYQLLLISVIPTDAVWIAITDTFAMNDDRDMYEYGDLMDSIIDGWLYYSRNSFPYLELKYNSDDITISEQLFIQIIGPYTAGGSTTADQVIFEGIAKKPTKGRIQHVLVENQGSEMEYISPRGNKSGRSDQIITDINDDGAPNGPTYITDGTLVAGKAMGTLDLSGAKIYRVVLNDLAEHDVFLWNLRPQGAIDYNAGNVDSGADIRYDGSGNLDPIMEVKSWTIAKLNQIIVNGAINPITGEPHTGKWDDIADQQLNGTNSDTIEDAQLNTAALCQSKADDMGANETARTRARFKFRKITYGLIQPGQTITFKYDIANYMTIAEAQFILDKLTMNIKTEVGYAEISSGL